MTFDPLRTLPLLVGTPALPLLGRESTVTTNRERERGERERVKQMPSLHLSSRFRSQKGHIVHVHDSL